jgi:hypothetical protein
MGGLEDGEFVDLADEARGEEKSTCDIAIRLRCVKKP